MSIRIFKGLQTMRFNLKSFAVAAIIAGAFAASAAANAAEYMVGIGGTYRPFEFQDANKQLVGFDVDLIKAIAKKAGFEVKLINTPWSSIFPSLENGERDIIMSGITITEKRRQAVDFSHPYFLAHQLILTSQGLKISSIQDLKGKKISVVSASAGDEAASAAFGKTSPDIKRFDNTPLALEELANGGVDAMIGDVGVLQFYMRQNPDKHFNSFADPSFKQQYFGIGVRKGNVKVLNEVNKGLEAVIESGEYNEIYKKWFGGDAPKLPRE